jgi:hypothetical protein
MQQDDDFVSHRGSWREALVIARDLARVSPPDVDDKAYWEHEIRAYDRAFAAYAPGAIPDDFMTHREAWRKALETARDHAKVSAPDVDDKAYWERELRAFDRAFAAIGLDRKLPELPETTVYQPDDAHRPNKLGGLEVFLSLAEGHARYPDIPADAWRAITLKGNGAVELVNISKQQLDAAARPVEFARDLPAADRAHPWEAAVPEDKVGVLPEDAGRQLKQHGPYFAGHSGSLLRTDLHIENGHASLQ